MGYNKVTISSGHSSKCIGAVGLISEVNEARKVVDRVAEYLKQLGVAVNVFHDDTSTTQSQNLQTIVNYHNRTVRDIDISIHFNAHKTTDSPMGTETLYYDASELASGLSQAIANVSGLKNRGGKQRQELYFLKNTAKKALLVEICFVDSKADVDLYQKHFDAICKAIAEHIAGKKLPTKPNAPKQSESPQKSNTEVTEGVFTPSNQAMRDAVSTVLLRLSNKENGIDQSWRDKFNAGQMTESDAIALIYVAIFRGLLK